MELRHHIIVKSLEQQIAPSERIGLSAAEAISNAACREALVASVDDYFSFAFALAALVYTQL
jgi:hypothetical protein